jgi:LDH2 family malate/lactate/ureidoglycolate dehydrogenase
VNADPLMPPLGRPISAQRLCDFATAVLVAGGLEGGDARLVADSLVQADLWGHESHGVMRLASYVARIRSRAVAADAKPALVVDSRAIAVMDGRHVMGQVAAAQAMAEAIRRAKAHGVGAVSVRNSNHFGTAMYFTLMAAAQGCIGFLSTNASPAMPPWGGCAKGVGTNPWSWAAPAGRHPPMVLDIANTAVARGKIFLAGQRGSKIPSGWALDEQGQPTTDPVAALRGITLPMGGHKGYAISVMMDVLSGVLSGGAFGAAVHGPYQADERGDVGHLVIALDIAAFLRPDDFGARMERLIDELRGAARAAGHEEILYPGEPEARNDARLRKSGLVLPEQTARDLAELAGSCGMMDALHE